jgi:hypothetical protein
VSYQKMFADKPAKADPLVLEAEVQTYSTSDKKSGHPRPFSTVRVC